MTSTASTHRRGGWLVLLLAAALTALVTMVLGLVNAGTASAVTTSSAGSSASSSSAAGTRVGVSTSEPILVVGGSGSIAAGQGRGEALSQPYLASGCCVAAEDGIDSIPGLKAGWQGRVADNGKGWVWQRPGATGNGDMMRVMDPTPQYPNGYVRFYNDGGQPLGLDGKPGPNSLTHIPRNPDGSWSVPKGWN